MYFVLVALGSFAAFHAEIMVYEAEFQHYQTFPACAAAIFGYAELAFTGNAVDEFFVFICTAVVGWTGGTDAGSPFCIHDLFAIVCLLLPGVIEPLFKDIRTVTPLSVTGDLIIDRGGIFRTFFAVNKYFFHHLFE